MSIRISHWVRDGKILDKWLQRAICNGWILFSELTFTLCLAAFGEREWKGKEQMKEEGRKGEAKNASLFVFGHRGERRRVCFSLVLFVDWREGKAYLTSFFWLICPYKKYVGIKVRSMKVIPKYKLLPFFPFWPDLDRHKNLGLNVNCIRTHHLSSPFPPTSKKGNNSSFHIFSSSFFLSPISTKPMQCRFRVLHFLRSPLPPSP